ncbi:MAG: beta-ketoacyl-[acyl-carrier-protein] synthase family protein [Planctomycetes bacterium]|nr:beta-ketoacyl-[acyl-carrier-protein] synthase family protein [Planctomycetota bacterium]
MHPRITIAGVGTVAPQGMGNKRYIEALLAGESGIKAITHFDVNGLSVKIAGFVKDFEPTKYLDEHTLKHVGRVVPMSIAASKEAFAEAGIDPEKLTLEERRRFAVVLGSGGGAMEFVERQYDLWYKGAVKKASVYVVPSGTMGNMASEVSMVFGLRGPSHVITTGCTSSSDALGYAMMLLRDNRADRVLVGGADCTVTRGMMEGLCLMGILASKYAAEPARASRPFDGHRDGFVLSEGAWMMILERDGKKAIAEMAGHGGTCDAHHRVRMAEDGVEPARSMQLACEDAGIRPDQIDAVWLHGTGTQLNDRIETKAVKLALGDRARKIPMTAIKSMIGHPQGACGSAAAVGAILAMQAGAIPPTINLENPDPDCDLDYTPLRAKDCSARIVLVSTLGFGSKNAAIIIKKA